jgi:hypothetical protein
MSEEAEHLAEPQATSGGSLATRTAPPIIITPGAGCPGPGGFPGFRFAHPGYASRRKPEMHHVAVGDHVVLSFEPHPAGVARAGFPAERLVVRVRDGLGAVASVPSRF